MDQCMVQCHSRGRLLRKNVDAFASKVSPDFVAVIPALLERNIRLAVVTHSDLAQHTPTKPRRCRRRDDGPNDGGVADDGNDDDDRVVVLGDELVHEVLLRAVPEHAHEFFVVAWRPKSWGSEGTKDQGKLRHMRTCAAFYDVPLDRCVLFDDDPTNCALTDTKHSGHTDRGSFLAYKCDPEKGFRLTDYHDDTNPS